VELSTCGFEIHRGERVLVIGEPGAAVLLGRAIAGLWGWGHGEIYLPERADISFLSDRPYLPEGPLRDSVIFPAAPDDFPDTAIRRALFHVGLDHLIEKLDQTQHWEHSLSVNEQQRLAFARLLLHRPEWILLVGATDALGAKGEREIMTLLRQELPSATLVVLGHPEHSQAYYHRHLIIEGGQATAVLREKTA
jgi:putative ATP-binding cassette transporter